MIRRTPIWILLLIALPPFSAHAQVNPEIDDSRFAMPEPAADEANEEAK